MAVSILCYFSCVLYNLNIPAVSPMNYLIDKYFCVVLSLKSDNGKWSLF